MGARTLTGTVSGREDGTNRNGDGPFCLCAGPWGGRECPYLYGTKHGYLFAGKCGDVYDPQSPGGTRRDDDSAAVVLVGGPGWNGTIGGQFRCSALWSADHARGRLGGRRDRTAGTLFGGLGPGEYVGSFSGCGLSRRPDAEGGGGIWYGDAEDADGTPYSDRGRGSRGILWKCLGFLRTGAGSGCSV